jgi:hypothetical protein
MMTIQSLNNEQLAPGLSVSDIQYSRTALAGR